MKKIIAILSIVLGLLMAFAAGCTLPAEDVFTTSLQNSTGSTGSTGATGNTDPTDPADAKSIAPNNKHEARNAVLSFLIAAVVSVVAIWVYSFFDVVIRDKKKLIDNVDVPILGVIPRHDLPATTKGGNGKNA